MKNNLIDKIELFEQKNDSNDSLIEYKYDKNVLRVDNLKIKSNLILRFQFLLNDDNLSEIIIIKIYIQTLTSFGKQ